MLARRLKEGEACPVCGAKHHPHPAVIPGHVPEKETLEKEKALLEEKQAAVQRLSVEAGHLAKEEDRLKEEIGEKAGLILGILEDEEAQPGQTPGIRKDEEAQPGQLPGLLEDETALLHQIRERDAQLKEEEETAARRKQEEVQRSLRNQELKQQIPLKEKEKDTAQEALNKARQESAAAQGQLSEMNRQWEEAVAAIGFPDSVKTGKEMEAHLAECLSQWKEALSHAEEKLRRFEKLMEQEQRQKEEQEALQAEITESRTQMAGFLGQEKHLKEQLAADTRKAQAVLAEAETCYGKSRGGDGPWVPSWQTGSASFWNCQKPGNSFFWNSSRSRNALRKKSSSWNSSTKTTETHCTARKRSWRTEKAGGTRRRKSFSGPSGV